VDPLFSFISIKNTIMLEMEINCPILDPVLHIKAGDKTVVETNAFSLVKIAGEISWPIYANTAMPALV